MSKTAKAKATKVAAQISAKAGARELLSLAARELVAAANIRHQVDREQVESMKSAIKAKGVLQNLIAAPRKSDSKYAVFAGGTRLVAIQELITDGDLPQDYEVPVMVFGAIDPESPDAIEIAMLENMIRSQMDYVDECSAMAQLADARRTEEEIAAIFGYRPKTVHERLLIAKLIPEAHALVRSKARNLAWARALTIADASMQKQICDDIAANPQAWESGEDIRKFLTRSTVPAKNAIFDLEDYKGVIVSDMFEGDALSDVEEFWTLQNAAIDDLQKEIEAEGYAQVIVTREPFASWQYEDESDTSKALAFIEVMPNGAVSVIRNKVAIMEDAATVRALDAADIEAGNALDEIADHEVRATASICDYAAAQRSAIVQAEMSSNFRAALEYAVIAMIGHRNASYSAQVYSMPGAPTSHRGRAFDAMADVAGAVQDAIPLDAPTPDVREIEQVAMVRSMPDEALQILFTQLTAQRVGQQRRRGIDDADNSLMNVFGADIDVRQWWTPDEAFFELMASEDLRRLATALLHSAGASSTRFASAKKKALVRALATNFADARDGVLSGEVARSLNAWVPGVMSFPAAIEMKSDADGLFEEGEDDIDALLFDEDAA